MTTIECPRHEGAFDCTPFCPECEGNQEFEAPLTEEELIESFDDMLNTSYPEVSIGVCTFNASTILKECDPVAYRVSLHDYADLLVEAGTKVEGY